MFNGTHWSKMPNREEILAHISATKKGRKLSAAHRRSISRAHKGRTPANWKSIFGKAWKPCQWLTCKGCKGKFQTSKEKGYAQTTYCSRNCYKKYFTGTRGKKRKSNVVPTHWNWKGGITPINHALRQSLEYEDWRKKVLERDDYTCLNCGQIGGWLEVDHIKPWSRFPKLRFDITNGRTLCKPCHIAIGWSVSKHFKAKEALAA